MDSNIPSAGGVLLGEPFGPDPFFRRSVVFLTEHSLGGAVGFVLNKPLPVEAGELVEEPALAGFPVYMGGPVEPMSLHYIYSAQDIFLSGAVNINDHIRWGGDFARLKELARQGRLFPDKIRFFLGYSGWDGGQLEAEIINGAWRVAQTGLRRAFSDLPGLWASLAAENCFADWLL